MRATTSLINAAGLAAITARRCRLDRKAAIRRADVGIVGGAAWLSMNE
jgi:hypothetical protein